MQLAAYADCGGHVLELAARDRRVAAVIAQAPHTSGLAALGSVPLARQLHLTVQVARDLAHALLRRAPHYSPNVRCPLLVLVAEHDRLTPPRGALEVARTAARGELRRYAVDHLDLYTGEVFERAVSDMLGFLRAQLPPAQAMGPTVSRARALLSKRGTGRELVTSSAGAHGRREGIRSWFRARAPRSCGVHGRAHL